MEKSFWKIFGLLLFLFGFWSSLSLFKKVLAKGSSLLFIISNFFLA